MTAGAVIVEGELNDTATAWEVLMKLPIEGKAQRWGEEIYFEIPVQAELEEDAREVVEKGDLGYWPTGSAFCMFFGPTPMSQGDEIRAASKVNIIGQIKGNFSKLTEVADGEQVLIEKI
ncbi:MAG: hypothetical protein GY869_01005 [Planctomycetes bacterium]|nr:hypothetical protein [Planctomycetota bacterium]